MKKTNGRRAGDFQKAYSLEVYLPVDTVYGSKLEDTEDKCGVLYLETSKRALVDLIRVRHN